MPSTIQWLSAKPRAYSCPREALRPAESTARSRTDWASWSLSRLRVSTCTGWGVSWLRSARPVAVALGAVLRYWSLPSVVAEAGAVTSTVPSVATVGAVPSAAWVGWAAARQASARAVRAHTGRPTAGKHKAEGKATQSTARDAKTLGQQERGMLGDD